MDKKPTRLYCGLSNGKFSDFFGNPLGVKMSGHTEEEVVEVIVREAKSDETQTHYSWWNKKDEKFTLIFYSKLQVETCFPYGSKIEVELGHGEICRVVVEIIEKQAL